MRHILHIKWHEFMKEKENVFAYKYDTLHFKYCTLLKCLEALTKLRYNIFRNGVPTSEKKIPDFCIH